MLSSGRIPNDSGWLAKFRVKKVMMVSDAARLPRVSYRYPMVVPATVNLLFAIMHGKQISARDVRDDRPEQLHKPFNIDVFFSLCLAGIQRTTPLRSMSS
jgi:hypothetical protein